MNDKVRDFAISEILSGLEQVTDGNRDIFVRMYGTKNGTRSVDDARAMSLADICAEIPENALENAMDQIERTILRNAEKARGEGDD